MATLTQQKWIILRERQGLLTAIGVAHGQTSSPSNAPGAFVDVDGGRLFYEECGSGEDTVFLLHDRVANSAAWDDVWPDFCKRFHAIRYDRRGYGRSPATTKPYYEADDLAALLRARKVTHTALVASSHGGEVALNFTLRTRRRFPYSEWFLMRYAIAGEANLSVCAGTSDAHVDSNRF